MFWGWGWGWEGRRGSQSVIFLGESPAFREPSTKLAPSQGLSEEPMLHGLEFPLDPLSLSDATHLP